MPQAMLRWLATPMINACFPVSSTPIPPQRASPRGVSGLPRRLAGPLFCLADVAHHPQDAYTDRHDDLVTRPRSPPVGARDRLEGILPHAGDDGALILAGGHGALYKLQAMVEIFVELSQQVFYAAVGAEVREQQAFGVEAAHLRHRALPGRHVQFTRRCRCAYIVRAGQRHTREISGEEISVRPIPVDVVMPRVARGIHCRQPACPELDGLAIGEHADTIRGNR